MSCISNFDFSLKYFIKYLSLETSIFVYHLTHVKRDTKFRSGSVIKVIFNDSTMVWPTWVHKYIYIYNFFFLFFSRSLLVYVWRRHSSFNKPIIHIANRQKIREKFSFMLKINQESIFLITELTQRYGTIYFRLKYIGYADLVQSERMIFLQIKM